MKTALTIAGFDPSSGAGLQADLKVFSKLGFYGLSVITAITVQNTQSVREVWPVDGGLVYKQLSCLVDDIDIDCVKIGMLYSEGVVEEVSRFLSEYSPKITVIDPIIRSSSGKGLIEERAFRMLIEELFQKSTTVTPNIAEAEAISGIDIRSAKDMRIAAQNIHKRGPSVVITGGHFSELVTEGPPTTIDMVFDGNEYLELKGKREIGEFHGTGCIYSSALAVYLTEGYHLFEAAKMAKGFVNNTINSSVCLGKGMRLFT